MGEKSKESINCKNCFAPSYYGASECNKRNCQKWRDWKQSEKKFTGTMIYVQVRYNSFCASYGRY